MDTCREEVVTTARGYDSNAKPMDYGYLYSKFNAAG